MKCIYNNVIYSFFLFDKQYIDTNNCKFDTIRNCYIIQGDSLTDKDGKETYQEFGFLIDTYCLYRKSKYMMVTKDEFFANAEIME